VSLKCNPQSHSCNISSFLHPPLAKVERGAPLNPSFPIALPVSGNHFPVLVVLYDRAIFPVHLLTGSVHCPWGFLSVFEEIVVFGQALDVERLRQNIRGLDHRMRTNEPSVPRTKFLSAEKATLEKRKKAMRV